MYPKFFSRSVTLTFSRLGSSRRPKNWTYTCIRNQYSQALSKEPNVLLRLWSFCSSTTNFSLQHSQYPSPRRILLAPFICRAGCCMTTYLSGPHLSFLALPPQTLGFLVFVPFSPYRTFTPLVYIRMLSPAPPFLTRSVNRTDFHSFLSITLPEDPQA